MASLLIRNFDDALRDRLKERARANHRSMEEEARERLRASIVQEANIPAHQETLVDIADRIFGQHGGFELDIAPRGSMPGREPPDFSGPEYDP